MNRRPGHTICIVKELLDCYLMCCIGASLAYRYIGREGLILCGVYRGVSEMEHVAVIFSGYRNEFRKCMSLDKVVPIGKKYIASPGYVKSRIPGRTDASVGSP